MSINVPKTQSNPPVPEAHAITKPPGLLPTPTEVPEKQSAPVKPITEGSISSVTEEVADATLPELIENNQEAEPGGPQCFKERVLEVGFYSICTAHFFVK